MLRVKAVAERMGDHLVRHHAAVPGVGKTAQAVHATHRFKESLHASMMTILPRQYKAIQNRGGAFRVSSRHGAAYRRRLLSGREYSPLLCPVRLAVIALPAQVKRRRIRLLAV